jgi:hypothetical protein
MKKAKVSKNALTRKALAALQSAVAKVVAKARRDGRPIAVWRNGKAVLVSAGRAPVVRETPAAYRMRSRRRKS